MSLINKVIYDLEDRQALNADKRGRIFRGLSSAVNPQHKNKLLTADLFIVFLFLLASVAGTYAVMEKRADRVLENINITGTPVNLSKSVVTDIENTISPSVFDTVGARTAENPLKLDFSLSSLSSADVDPRREKSGKARAGVTSVWGISLSRHSSYFLLKLQTSSEVDYRTYTLSNPSRIVIEIDNAVFDGEIPDLAYQGGVSDLRVRQDESGRLLVELDTTDDYSIEKTELLPSAQGFALNLSMLSHAISVSEERRDRSAGDGNAKHSAVPEYTDFGDMEKNISSGNEVNKARTMYMDARELYRRGKIRQANELLVAILEKNSGHKVARTLLVQKLIEQGQLQRAEELLKTGLSMQGSETTWNNLYARLLVNRGEVDTAIEVLTNKMPVVSSDPEYYAFLAALYQKVGHHADAVLIYRQILQGSPGNSVWWMGLAISLESLQQRAEAISAYRMSLRGTGMTQDLQKYVQGKIKYLTRRG